MHLPEQQQVYFRAGNEAAALERADEHDTHLTAWFKLNQRNVAAREHLYANIPYHFVFKEHAWCTRQRGGEKIVSRLYSAQPSEGERFYLRILLLHVPGATSFESLRTFNGELFPTFREACLARGLLQDDNEWNGTLLQVATIGTPWQLRQTFSFILSHCEVNDPLTLWLTHRNSMIEDFLRTMQDYQAEQAALGFIAGIIGQSGKRLSDFGLPETEEAPVEPPADLVYLGQEADNIRSTLNPEQLEAADTIIRAVMNVHNNSPQNNRLFFIDGPGGTGKTYTYNYIIKELKRRGMKVGTSAWTGIAATLLDGGRTVHSLFRLPVPIVETSTCNVPPTSNHATFLMQQDLYIFDEASMIPKHALQAIETMFRDISNVDNLFGGKVILLGGDFRQILPVVKRARPAEIVETCLKSSYIWPTVQVFRLTHNMRAGQNQQIFANWLLQLGDGILPTKATAPFTNSIEIPETCIIREQNDQSHVDAVFGDGNLADFASRIILTPTNDVALDINNKILNKIPGEIVTYNSADSVVSDDPEEIALYPVEFLNSITPSGMPPHNLQLKLGAVIMLLRNLDLKHGLCNGTRLIVQQLRQHVIDAEIITGVATGKRVLIPRIQLAPSDTGLPFQLRRRQFPIRLAYAMTINKSQGQTFNKVGIYLHRPCFSHGQLYVAFSRARSFEDVKVKIHQTEAQGYVQHKCYTPNIVYSQVL
ncbi:ATP-dependent DNA helicase PIF1-like [Hydractinia symbiolongicarpus]|uniref:ATP-dependent DNA helicase PIF1-like n=1 Tax=Hydractinia symbiolongicarpus TaxID=13093 RepID=UPI002550A429|nr:ATP-dependent DNA helicase PIF1-like [Hydractinia symbiolongicarpus]